MPNPKAFATLYIMLVAALATAQTLTITANIQPYGAPPYSPKVNGTTFNLYEWVVINGTVTPQADFYGNIAVTVFDTATNLPVASCTATDVGLSQGVTYKLYNVLQGRCTLTPNPGYTYAGLVKIRSDGLALNFTDVPLVGPNRYILNVTFRSTAGSRTFNPRFSVSNEVAVAVKAFGVGAITEGTTYRHNVRYDFRLVVNVTHRDGRPYYNNSITVYVNDVKQEARYWANRTGSASGEQYGASINNATWVLTIPSSVFSSAGSYRIMVNVSNVKMSVNSAPSRVGYNVNGVNAGRLNFTLAVNNRLTVEFVNVTAVWPNYTSTPPSLRNKPTGVNYASAASFNSSRWTLGDAFLLYVRVKLANGTTLSPSSLTKEFRDYGYPLIAGVANMTTARGGLVVVAVNATLPKSEWSYYKAAYSGVRVNATLSVSDGSNTGSLPLWFVVTNTTKTFTQRLFFNASGFNVRNGSRVNLGDVLALDLTVVTYGGRTLNFTGGFSIRVYNVTRLGLGEYTLLFDIRPKNNIIYLVVKPSRDAWRITSANWRSFMNKTYLAVNVTECGMSGRMNLTLWWPGYLGGGRYRSHHINVTAKLPSVSFTVNRTTVDYYGRAVRLTFTFTTYGGNRTVAKNLTLYIYKIDTQRRPFGWSNASKPFIYGETYLRAGNYTFEFNVNGSKIWIPGVWYINATVGDVFGNAGDLNNTQLFTIRPKIVHSLPASLRVVAGKTASISSSLAWGNTTLIGSDAKLNITVVYPTSDGLSYVTTTLGNIANSFTASIPAPNVPGSYRVNVTFAYMTFGKKQYDTWVINLTVYVSVNATVSDMRSNPNLVAVAVGRSVPRGPVRGALVEDNLAAAALASVIGTTNVFFDDELLDPNTLAYKTAAGSYRYFIAVGGPLVNLFSYKFNATLSSIVQTYKEVVADEVVEVGFKIKVPGDITRVYLNLTDNKYYILYANGTVKVAGDYGKTDFAFVATLYDVSVGKYIFISFGLDWRGTVAAGRWIAANINNLDSLANGQLVLLQWTDVNNDGNIQPGEVQRILSA
jgi:hypothetical protein